MATDHRSVVRALIAEADRRAASGLDQKVHKGVALAQLLAEREGLQYKPPSVRAWMRGDAMPPADVLLAVARSVGISIDELSGRLDGRQPQTADRLDDLEGQLATLSETVYRLQEAAGASERQAQRREWARRSRAPAPATPEQPTPGARSADRPRAI